FPLAHSVEAIRRTASRLPDEIPRTLMAALQYVVEGGSTLSGTIRPSGNKNAALPIVAAALLSEEPVTLENVPRIRDVETLVELIRSAGVAAEWKQRNTLLINAKTVKSADLDP